MEHKPSYFGAMSRLTAVSSVLACLPFGISADGESSPPLTRLSDQGVSPYLSMGRLVDEQHPRWEEYREPITQFPSVRACLAPSEQETDTPNVMNVDWDIIHGPYAVQVCLFRIFDTLGSPELVAEWMEQNGFRDVGNLDRSEMMPKFDRLVVGQWTYEDTVARSQIISGPINRLMNGVVQPSTVISARFSGTKLLSVGLSAKTK